MQLPRSLTYLAIDTALQRDGLLWQYQTQQSISGPRYVLYGVITR